ncbi:MAG: hypothetical protein ACPGUD_09860 [Parashewanella sp.]
MNGIKPINVNQPINSHRQLNRMQVNQPQPITSNEQSGNNVSVSSIKTEANIHILTEKELEAQSRKVDKIIDEMFAFEERAKSEAKTMLNETQNVLDEIAQEQPSLLNKEFDFTHNGEEIEVIDHNLSKKEYNYLKAKLNANEELVKATDFLNLSAAKQNTRNRDDNRLYTKENIAGRIHVMDVIKQAQTRTAGAIEITTPGVISEPYDIRARYHEQVHLNVLDIANETSPAFSTRA